MGEGAAKFPSPVMSDPRQIAAYIGGVNNHCLWVVAQMDTKAKISVSSFGEQQKCISMCLEQFSF